jgi:hypothetical protein
MVLGIPRNRDGKRQKAKGKRQKGGGRREEVERGVRAPRKMRRRCKKVFRHVASSSIPVQKCRKTSPHAGRW